MRTSSSLEDLRRSRILSSKLYFDIPPSKVPLIYSSDYNISFLGMEKLHPFDSSKWGRICRFLSSEGVLDKSCIVEPEEASKEDLLVVHPEKYLDSLQSSSTVAKILVVPPVVMLPNCIIQRKILYPFRKQVGGSVLAAKLAKERGWAINVGGGFHHCSADEGGGFCAYADISLCIHFAFVQLNISRVMIIDLDAHQGNGHEIDFSNDKRVYIIDMYNSEVYPLKSRFLGGSPMSLDFLVANGLDDLDHMCISVYQLNPSFSNYLQGMQMKDLVARRYINQNIEIPSGTTTDVYLKKLDEALEVARQKFDPELVVYNAGTDILDRDPLGCLKISPEGIIKRDEKVFGFAREKGIPILMLTSGGYMKSSARVIADSIINLSRKKLIDMSSTQNTAGTGG